jgi:hypothetical protein
MSNIYNAFGCLWRFELSGREGVLPRWILLPTISVYCQHIVKDGFNIFYYNIDFMWLRSVATFEVEQLDLNK